MRLSLMQIDAIFALERHDILFPKLLELEQNPKLPARLRLRVFIYLAKLYTFNGNDSKSKIYKGLVKGMLSALAQDTANPESLIEYGNFQIYLKEYDHGIEIFEKLEQRFESHSNHQIKKHPGGCFFICFQ